MPDYIQRNPDMHSIFATVIPVLPCLISGLVIAQVASFPIDVPLGDLNQAADSAFGEHASFIAGRRGVVA